MSIILQHDGPLELALGQNRKSTSWRNVDMAWSVFLAKISQTHRTAETLVEYNKAKRERQAEIKDIGGFVGGYLAGGRRKTEAVLHRSLITLDFDFAKPDTWENFISIYPYAAAVYSTHKHTPEAPRFRVVLPVNRSVDRDEYEAISRRVAAWIGINETDHTTFEAARLMYWPSTSKDGEFMFDYQDGPWINADEVLATYKDWRDSSAWPVAASENGAVVRAAKKQGDPLEKPGIIGAFCRTYSISEAIRIFLPDVYTPTDLEDRYTFTGGSTAAGLVVYEDKYAYSHHGSDLISGKLCNAFDLVRIHLYGLKDEDVKADTSHTKLPSYLAMCDLATQDKDVRGEIAAHRLSEAMVDFSGELVMDGLADQIAADPEDDQAAADWITPPAAQGEDWTKELDVDKNGAFKPTYENLILILQNDPNLRGRFSFNDFTKKEIIGGPLPWRKNWRSSPYLQNIDLIGLKVYLERVYEFSSLAKAVEALDYVVHERRFHPVRDYLSSLEWDGTPRVESLLIDYLGAEDSEYCREVTRKTMAAAVARVMRPGTKFDYVLTLVGVQGVGKSTFIKKLGGAWYCENLTTVQGKDASEQLHGVWLMEMGELAGLKKAEVEIIKNFISRTEDSYRPAYAQKKETYPRQCIFIGTTNNDDFLRDPTGNRRFWPVVIGLEAPAFSVHDDITDEVRAQIWAEAVAIWKAGERLYLDQRTEAMARMAQGAHTEIDGREGVLYDYLETKLPETWEELSTYERRAWLQGENDMKAEGTERREVVSAAEVFCEAFNGQIKDMTPNNTKPIVNMIKGSGVWVPLKHPQRRGPYGRQRCFCRVEYLAKYQKNIIISQ